MKFLVALLTALAGILHVLVGFHLIGGGEGTNMLLVLNGVGYLVLLVLFWQASGNGGIIRWILLVYALVTLIGYFFKGAGFTGGALPLTIKAIELLLILLLLLYRGARPVAVSAPAAATRTATKIETRAGDAAVDLSAAASRAATSIDTAADRAGEAVTDVADRAGEAVEEAKSAVADVADKAGEAVGEARTAAADAAGDAVEAVEGVADEAAGSAGKAVDAVEGAVDSAVHAAEDAASDVGEAAADAASDVAGAAAAAVEAVKDAGGDGATAATGAVRSGAAAISTGIQEAEDDVADDGSGEESLIAELRDYFQSLEHRSEYSKPVEYIEGVGAVYGQKLRALNVNTVLDLLLGGATRRGRKQISDQSGISPSLILTWVNHADLFRIKGVGQEYADLLEEAGVDTVMELAQRNPANLHKRMLEVNDEKSLVRRPPHASEVKSWVEQAKDMRRAVYY